MPCLILRGMMLTHFVRVVNNKQKKSAVKVSGCFLHDKSNYEKDVFFWYVWKILITEGVPLIITRICTVECQFSS